MAEFPMQCTLARWERGEREPTGKFEAQASRFVNAVETMLTPAVKIA